MPDNKEKKFWLKHGYASVLKPGSIINHQLFVTLTALKRGIRL
jgi:hypothetical protein